jgi:hypothetical protein
MKKRSSPKTPNNPASMIGRQPISIHACPHTRINTQTLPLQGLEKGVAGTRGRLLSLDRKPKLGQHLGRLREGE